MNIAKKKRNVLNKPFLMKFNDDQINQIKETAEMLNISASAFIRQSCSRNLEIVRHLEIPRFQRRHMANNEWL
jgi:hypothetical protein